MRAWLVLLAACPAAPAPPPPDNAPPAWTKQGPPPPDAPTISVGEGQCCYGSADNYPKTELTIVSHHQEGDATVLALRTASGATFDIAVAANLAVVFEPDVSQGDAAFQDLDLDLIGFGCDRPPSAPVPLVIPSRVLATDVGRRDLEFTGRGTWTATQWTFDPPRGDLYFDYTIDDGYAVLTIGAHSDESKDNDVATWLHRALAGDCS